MSAISFDTIEMKSKEVSGLRPFWTIDNKDDDLLKDWVFVAYDTLKEQEQDRRQIMMANMAAYRGIHYKLQDTRTRELETRNQVPLLRQPRLVVNHIYDLIEQHVSRVTKYRPAVNADPASDDHDDVVTSKVTDALLDYVWYMNDIDSIFQRYQRHNRVIGEAFVEPKWDKTKGGVDPDWKKERKKSKDGRVKLIGEDGSQMTNSNGDPLWITGPVKMGDVGYRVTFSWELFLQPKTQYENCEWAIREEWIDVDDLRAEYPDKEESIKCSGDDGFILNTETFVEEDRGNKALVCNLYHKATTKLGGGFFARVTRDCVLDRGELPEEYCGEFPWTRVTDIDNPGAMRGYSTLEQGRPIQGLYNNITSLMTKYLFLVSHPKWMMPRNACKMEALGNDATIVQYQGPMAPQLVNPPAINPAIFSARESAKADLEQIMAVGGVSRGQPPAGVRAFIALQYLDEKDNERQNAAIQKHNAAIRELAVKTIWMMAAKYKDGDGRLEKILGRSHAASLKDFKYSNLRDITDVRVQTGSALPHQRSMRLQTILDLAERFPALMPHERVVSLLDLGQDKKFLNDATAAVNMAESENDTWLRSGKIDSPEKYEKHEIHYDIHMRLLNEEEFKYRMSQEAQQEFIDHVAATEMLMIEIAKKNPMYLQTIMTRFPQFPVCYEEEGLPLPQAPQPTQGAGGMMPQSENPAALPPDLTQEGTPAGVVPENLAPITQEMGM